MERCPAWVLQPLQINPIADRKSTRLNSSHLVISYAVFSLKKKSFFVPEHGTMFTLALVRFPPTATKEIQYLNAKGALTYTDIAGDPVLYGNLPPREISMKDVFFFGDSSTTYINTLSLHDALPI